LLAVWPIDEKVVVIEYRPFHNADPPRLVALWHQCRLGRGAAEGFNVDVMETLVFSQTYFDRAGLIVAQDDGRLIGFVHAGFGANADESGLDRQRGVICAVMVHPDYRRRGIGRKLVEQAETYLRTAGSKTIVAGPSPGFDPFYVGLYGGSRPSGFLESDANAAPFFQSLGYAAMRRNIVYQRDVTRRNDPISIRLVTIRRRMELVISDEPEEPTWWWQSRFGRLDSLIFSLIPKDGGEAVASAAVVGLDLYLPKWQERAVGVTDLYVKGIERRKGYGQALVLEIGRRLREEMVTLFEAHVAEDNKVVTELIRFVGFEPLDAGVVYSRDAG
jgi:ribosomal protein S18 acetylase RimI-like enzyme